MLSYQHIYHAGNMADCHKHALQAALLQLLARDKSPLLYIDTHSGRGLYDLRAPEMQKLGEFRQGIQKIWDQTWPREAAPYRRVLDSLNRNKQLQFYPGSPWVAEALRRPQDRLVLYELHPQEFKALKTNMGRLDGVTLTQDDGWSVMETRPFLPRGLIMVDPSYELKEEYNLMADRIGEIAANYPDFIITIWYPILAAKRYEAMTDMLSQLPSSVLKSELTFQTEKGMIGTGLFIINASDVFHATERIITNWLNKALNDAEAERL